MVICYILWNRASVSAYYGLRLRSHLLSSYISVLDCDIVTASLGAHFVHRPFFYQSKLLVEIVAWACVFHISLVWERSLQDIHILLHGHLDGALARFGSSLEVVVGLARDVVPVTAHESRLPIGNGHMVFSDDSFAHGNLTSAWGTHLLPVQWSER